MLQTVRLEAGDIAGVASLIVAVVTGHHLIILGLLLHHHLPDTLLARHIINLSISGNLVGANPLINCQVLGVDIDLLSNSIMNLLLVMLRVIVMVILE